MPSCGGSPGPTRVLAWLLATFLALVLPPALPGATGAAGEEFPCEVVQPLDRGSPRAVGATSAAAPVCLDCGVERLEYLDLPGEMLHQLWRHPGRYVEVLLPDDRPAGALNAQELRELIDLLDLAYEGYADLMGAEPAGDGRLQVAFLWAREGGRGLQGMKGVEIYASIESGLRRTLRFGALDWILLHELAHNFDLYSLRTQYVPDHFHAWTAFIDPYMPYFLQVGDNTPSKRRDRAGLVRPPRSPAETLRLTVHGTWWPLLDDPQSSWESCVLTDACFWDARHHWGAFHFYLASQFGVWTTREFFRALAVRAAQPIGVLPPAREEVWLEAWADATRSDVTCYAEALRWHTSEALRERIRQRYGSHAPLCADDDGDGFRRIEGDCDDGDPLVHPGRRERENGIDDDCDGHVDELLVAAEPGAPQEIPFPSELAASGRPGEKQEFRFLPGRGPVAWTEVCYEGQAGGGFVFLKGNREGQAEGYRGACLYGKVATRQSGPVRFRHDTREPGEYRVTVAPGDPWPVRWATLAEPVVTAGQVRFRVTSDLSRIAERPTHVRFWVTGTGWVATRRFRRQTRGSWTLPPDVPAGRFGVRAQLLRNGVPISQPSPMRIFEIG